MAEDLTQAHVAYFGYEVDLHGIILEYLRRNEPEHAYVQYLQDHPKSRELSIAFFDAAWELCRRGVLRPSVEFMGGQGVPDGTGYSLTTQGRRWIEDGAPTVLLSGPERINQLFEKLSARLGVAFLQRATEAAHCHRYGIYVACCGMCGAAAESILLAVAIAKSNDEEKVLKLYQARSGRETVINLIIGQARQSIAAPFRSATHLLSYWRDSAAHGLTSSISEIEAHEALARLLRFAQFATDNWDELTES